MHLRPAGQLPAPLPQRLLPRRLDPCTVAASVTPVYSTCLALLTFCAMRVNHKAIMHTHSAASWNAFRIWFCGSAGSSKTASGLLRRGTSDMTLRTLSCIGKLVALAQVIWKYGVTALLSPAYVETCEGQSAAKFCLGVKMHV